MLIFDFLLLPNEPWAILVLIFNSSDLIKYFETSPVRALPILVVCISMTDFDLFSPLLDFLRERMIIITIIIIIIKIINNKNPANPPIIPPIIAELLATLFSLLELEKVLTFEISWPSETLAMISVVELPPKTNKVANKSPTINPSKLEQVRVVAICLVTIQVGNDCWLFSLFWNNKISFSEGIDDTPVAVISISVDVVVILFSGVANKVGPKFWGNYYFLEVSFGEKMKIDKNKKLKQWIKLK